MYPVEAGHGDRGPDRGLGSPAGYGRGGHAPAAATVHQSETPALKAPVARPPAQVGRRALSPHAVPCSDAPSCPGGLHHVRPALATRERLLGAVHMLTDAGPTSLIGSGSLLPRTAPEL